MFYYYYYYFIYYYYYYFVYVLFLVFLCQAHLGLGRPMQARPSGLAHLNVHLAQGRPQQPFLLHGLATCFFSLFVRQPNQLASGSIPFLLFLCTFHHAHVPGLVLVNHSISSRLLQITMLLQVAVDHANTPSPTTSSLLVLQTHAYHA